MKTVCLLEKFGGNLLHLPKVILDFDSLHGKDGSRVGSLNNKSSVQPTPQEHGFDRITLAT